MSRTTGKTPMPTAELQQVVWMVVAVTWIATGLVWLVRWTFKRRS